MKTGWQTDMMAWQTDQVVSFRDGLITALLLSGGWCRHYLHGDDDRTGFAVVITDGVASNGVRYIQYRLYENGKPVGEEPNEREP